MSRIQFNAQLDAQVVRPREFISSSPIGFFPRERRLVVEHRAAIHLDFDDSLADPRPWAAGKDPFKLVIC